MCFANQALESLPVDVWPGPAAPSDPMTSTRWAVAWALTETPTPGPLFVAVSHALEKLMEREGRHRAFGAPNKGGEIFWVFLGIY